MQLLGLSRSCHLWRDFLWEYEGVYWSFSAFLDDQTALVAKLHGVIYALEEAQKLGLTNVWLE